jgi:hypothetical protein
MARHDLSIDNQTTAAQRLLETYREKLVSFQKYVLKLRKQYLLGKRNADQTMVFFDTVALQCQQSILVSDNFWSHTTENVKAQLHERNATRLSCHEA